MNIEDASPSEMRAMLVDFARDEAEFSASRGLIVDLFPAIWVASSRMSTRAISRWLEETLDRKLSAVTIAKALRNPEKYWDQYADTLEPYILTFSNGHGVAIESFLKDEEVFEHLAKEPLHITTGASDYEHEQIMKIEQATDYLRKNWFSLPEAARHECIYHFSCMKDKDDAAEKKD